jgi:hypothetical protein
LGSYVLCEWEGNGGVGVCYYFVCALIIDAAKMCAVDTMFICVFLGVVVCRKRSDRVLIVAIW